MNNRQKNKPPSLSTRDKFNNLCKAIAEQELLEAGPFPAVKDAGELREDLTRLSRPTISGGKGKTPHRKQPAAGRTADKKPRARKD
jgi:hypothetical protein